jgi:1-deoxy-D-xylulose-5-phosphate synthase
MLLPDVPIEHGSDQFQLEQAGLTPAHIASTVLSLQGKTAESLQILVK